MRVFLLLCMMAFSGAAVAVQLPLGTTDAPACTPSATDPHAGAPSRRGRDRTPKKATLNALVEGKGVEEPAQHQALQACAKDAAQQIELRLLAAQPAESNSLFKKVFLRCVAEQNIPVSIYFVALKLEGHCEPQRPAKR